MNNAIFSNLTLVKEYPGVFLRKTKPLRIYRSESTSDNITTYRYHFGFPIELVKPFCPLLESTPFWGEQHWKEDNGFWIWWTHVVTKSDKYPIDELNKESKFRRDMFSKVVEFYSK